MSTVAATITRILRSNHFAIPKTREMQNNTQRNVMTNANQKIPHRKSPSFVARIVRYNSSERNNHSKFSVSMEKILINVMPNTLE